MPRQVIPGLGVREVKLLGGTPGIYASLDSSGEIRRLRELDHLGALTIVFPGMVHSRWDYAMTAAYLAGAIKPRDTSANVKFGPLPEMSYREAAQWIVLLNNVGHLPGTFAAEKGVLRFLTRRDASKPLDLLPIAGLDGSKLKRLNELVVQRDYAYFNRALGILKCIGKLALEPGCDLLGVAAEHVMLPFYCESLRAATVDWRRLRDFVSAIQRLAYLTIDASYVSVPSVSIPALIQPLLKDEMLSVGPLPLGDEEINLVRAYDQLVYETVYHAQTSRRISAVVASLADQALKQSGDPANLIWTWLGQSNLGAVIGTTNPEQLVQVSGGVSVRLVSLFLPSVRPAVAELQLLRIGGTQSHASHLTYRAWVPGSALRRIEAEALMVDLMVPKSQQTKFAARLLWWLFKTYDNEAEPSDQNVPMFLKEDVEEAYLDVIGYLLKEKFPCEEIRLVPWPNKIVRGSGPRRVIGTGDASSVIARFVFGARVRQKAMSPVERDQYHEYRGLRHVWLSLRLAAKKKPADPKAKRRAVVLICPASVQLRSKNLPIAEFDGVILVADARARSVKLHISEAKRGVSNKKAVTALTKRLDSLGLHAGASIISPTPFGAKAQIEL